METQIQSLQNYTFTAKYAMYLKQQARRETWEEAVTRSLNMHKTFYAPVLDKLQPYLDEAFEMYMEQKIVGSQRNLQFGGECVLKKHARSYNCCGSYVDRMSFFQEAMYNLLCGTGVGFSVQKHHIAKLPELNLEDKTEIVDYVIPDTIEGWADSCGILISSYFKSDIHAEYSGKYVRFDYGSIREKGSEFSHGIGRAPGPEPLFKAHERIRALLDEVVKAAKVSGQKKIRPIHAYDITMHMADAVISGGVRRSATICIFSHDDEEMMMAKTGKWFETHPWRGRSNNSALLLKNSTSKEEFSKLMKFTREFGEPGFYWADSTEMLPNPCVEIGFYCYDEFGNSGWQFCNLSSINGKRVKNLKDFYKAARAATIVGTLQAGYTSMPYLGEVTERIIRREALLGVSITGMMENASVLMNPENQKQVAESLKAINREVALIIGINPAARITCVKPEGSTSCMLGTSSGIHPHHSKRFIRRVQANKTEAPAKLYNQTNPTAVEESLWSANKTDVVLMFACEVDDSVVLKKNVTAIQMLSDVISTQNAWVETGKSKDLCTQDWLSHNVSNTVEVKNGEWEEVEDFIYNNRQYFAGISLLGSYGDKDYVQAPFSEVFTPEEIAKTYGNGSIFASGLIEEALTAFNGNLWGACSYLLYPPKPKTEQDPNTPIEAKENEQIALQKANWAIPAKKFAKNYLKNDLLTLTYLLKDVYNWKLWLDISTSHKKVDYAEIAEYENTTVGTQEIACAGGACNV